MKLTQFNRWLATVYLLLLVLTAASFMSVSYLASQQRQAAERQVRASQQAQRFVAATEALTRDVRAFVATGEAVFEHAYRKRPAKSSVILG